MRRERLVKALAYDTETTGLERSEGAHMFAYATSDWNGKTNVRRLDGPRKRQRSSLKRLREIWMGDGPERWAKVMHNARFDIGMTRDALGHHLRGNEIHETMALSHIFDNQRRSHALDNVAFEICGYPKAGDELTHQYMSSELGLAACPEHIMDKYQRDDVIRTMLLFRHFYPRLKKNGWEEIYESERRLVWTTLAIEERGIMISVTRCKRLIDWLHAETQKALDEYQSRGSASSTPYKTGELRHVLYRTLRLPVLGHTPKSGEPATDKFTLMALRDKTKHPIIEAVFRYRSYSRGISTIEKYMALADANGVIHPHIHPYRAATGREACSKPNLQNVQKATTLLNPYPVPARRAFRPKPGYVNFHIDYKGIEARLIINSCREPKLLQMVQDGLDTHDEYCRVIHGRRFDQLAGKKRKAVRDAGKNGFFCQGYGGGEQKWISTVGMPTSRGHDAFERVKRELPKLAELNRRDATFARNHGHVVTSFGRHLRVFKPHAATNYRTQGDAAGILKRAQPRVEDVLEVETGGEMGIILPIHDELIIECPRDRLQDAREVLQQVREVMIDFPQFDVPLEVEVDISTRDWDTLREYPLETPKRKAAK